MNKIFLTLAVIAAGLLSCNVRNNDKQADTIQMQTGAKDGAHNTANAAPTTVELLDTLYDFGTVAEGEQVQYSFRFKNTGNSPLIIADAHASCGCTVPEKPEQPVLPGQTGFIKVKFDSKGRPGKAHKTVTVTSNAQPEFKQLVISGDVKGNSQNN